MRTIYDEYGCSTPISNHLEKEVLDALRPVLKQWLTEGFHPREIHSAAAVALDHLIIAEILMRRNAAYEVPT